MIEKTTEKNDIIHNMAESSPGRQKNGTTRADLLLRLHNLWEAVPCLNHHPIRLPLGTFLVGRGEREGEEWPGILFSLTL